MKREMFTKNAKIIKFLITGGSSTLLDFIVYMTLSSSLGITISKFMSMTISSIYSFFINKNWTFLNKEKVSSILVIKYILCVVVNIIINSVTNILIYNLTGNKIISFIIATGIAMIVNYTIQKKIVFKEDQQK